MVPFSKKKGAPTKMPWAMVGFDGDEITIASEHAEQLDAIYARGGAGHMHVGEWQYEVDLRDPQKMTQTNARTGTTRVLVRTEAVSVACARRTLGALSRRVFGTTGAASLIDPRHWSEPKETERVAPWVSLVRLERDNEQFAMVAQALGVETIEVLRVQAPLRLATFIKAAEGEDLARGLAGLGSEKLRVLCHGPRTTETLTAIVISGLDPAFAHRATGHVGNMLGFCTYLAPAEYCSARGFGIPRGTDESTVCVCLARTSEMEIGTPAMLAPTTSDATGLAHSCVTNGALSTGAVTYGVFDKSRVYVAFVATVRAVVAPVPPPATFADVERAWRELGIECLAPTPQKEQGELLIGWARAMIPRIRATTPERALALAHIQREARAVASDSPEAAGLYARARSASEAREPEHDVAIRGWLLGGSGLAREVLGYAAREKDEGLLAAAESALLSLHRAKGFARVASVPQGPFSTVFALFSRLLADARASARGQSRKIEPRFCRVVHPGGVLVHATPGDASAVRCLSHGTVVRVDGESLDAYKLSDRSGWVARSRVCTEAAPELERVVELPDLEEYGPTFAWSINVRSALSLASPVVYVLEAGARVLATARASVMSGAIVVRRIRLEDGNWATVDSLDGTAGQYLALVASRKRRRSR